MEVGAPLVREVTDYEKTTGRTDAEISVEVRARVSGYLKEVNFKDGEMVKEGQVLFQIDPRPYQIDVAKNEAALAQAEAHLNRLDQDFERAGRLVGTRVINREEYDKIAGDRSEAAASVGSYRAALDNSKLYLEWTQVRSPISGRIGRRLIDKDNMVKADETALTTIVTLDPIYVYFDVDERSLLRLRREVQAGSSDGERLVARVELGLTDEEGFPHVGTLNFEDNRIDANTGTIRMRAVFANPRPTGKPRLLSPGLFARLRVPVGPPRMAVLVADRAIGTDQGKKFLYVVKSTTDPESRRVRQVVERRYVHIGGLQDGLREIKDRAQDKPFPPGEKLAPDEKVVVSGLQRIRPGVEVQPVDVKMPTPGAAESASRLRLGK